MSQFFVVLREEKLAGDDMWLLGVLEDKLEQEPFALDNYAIIGGETFLYLSGPFPDLDWALVAMDIARGELIRLREEEGLD